MSFAQGVIKFGSLHGSECCLFRKLDIFTTSIFYSNLNLNNKNDMAAHAFGMFFVPTDGRAKSAESDKVTSP